MAKAQYTVEVSLSPQFVTVWAHTGELAIRKAPWMIGAAGLAEFGSARVVAADYSEAEASNIGTAA